MPRNPIRLLIITVIITLLILSMLTPPNNLVVAKKPKKPKIRLEPPKIPIEYENMVTLLSEDFENSTVGSFPNATGWVLLKVGKGRGYQSVVNWSSTEGKVLRLWGLPKKPAVIAFRNMSLVGKDLLVLSVSFKLYLGNETFSFTTSIGNVTTVRITNEGTFIKGVKVSNYTLGTGWNWLGIIYVGVSGRLFIWLNNLLVKVNVSKAPPLISEVRFSSEGLTLLDDVYIVYVPIMRLEKVWETKPLGTTVMSIAWRPGEGGLYVGTAAGSLFIYHYSGDLWEPPSPLPSMALRISWSPNGALALIDSRGVYVTVYGRVAFSGLRKVWSTPINLTTGNPVVLHYSWAPNSKEFVVCASSYLKYAKGFIDLFKVYKFSTKGELIFMTDIFSGLRAQKVAWSPKGDVIAVAAVNYSELVIPGSPSRMVVNSYIIALSPDYLTELWRLNFSKGSVVDIEWSPDGSKLAVLIDHQDPYKEKFIYAGVYVFSPNGDLIWNMTGLPAESYDLGWSPSGKYLAVSADYKIFMFSADGKLLWDTKVHGKAILAWPLRDGALTLGIGKKVYFYIINYTAWMDLPEFIVKEVPTKLVLNDTMPEWYEPVIYKWFFGDGDGDWGRNVMEHGYWKGGWLPLKVVIENCYTHTEFFSIKWWIYVHVPPVAVTDIKPSKNVTLGTKLILNASGSYDLDSKVLTYKWLVNGTLLSNDTVVEWVPKKPGIYNITLIVTDPVGLTSSTHELIKVIKPKPTTTTTITTSTTTYTTTETTTTTTTTEGGGGGLPLDKILIVIIILLIIYAIIRKARSPY